VQGPKQPPRAAVCDRATPEPERFELVAQHHTILTICHEPDELIHMQ
jgi:hypothetical protein